MKKAWIICLNLWIILPAVTVTYANYKYPIPKETKKPNLTITTKYAHK